MTPDKRIEAAKAFAAEHVNDKKGTTRKKHHSLPISDADRAKREHDAAEHQRFEDVYGDLKITRDPTTHFITKVEKVAEDIVVERTYTRDSGDYITDVAIRIRIKKQVS